MKKKLTAALVLVIVSLTMAPVVWAEQEKDGRGTGEKAKNWRSPTRYYYMFKMSKDELGLTDQQLSQLKDIYFDLEEKQLAVRAENTNLWLGYKKHLDAEERDYKAIRANMDKRSAN